jgi:hypothetical protein
MSLSPRTAAHLRLADENRDLSHRLFALSQPPLRWVAVVAFYSAVHYIAAYLWETGPVEVFSHEERDREIDSDRYLQRIAGHYKRLFDISIRARYRPVAKLTGTDVQDFLTIDLIAIEHHVKSFLRGP